MHHLEPIFRTPPFDFCLVCCLPLGPLFSPLAALLLEFLLDVRFVAVRYLHCSGCSGCSNCRDEFGNRLKKTGLRLATGCPTGAATLTAGTGVDQCTKKRFGCPSLGCQPSRLTRPGVLKTPCAPNPPVTAQCGRGLSLSGSSFRSSPDLLDCWETITGSGLSTLSGATTNKITLARRF